MLAPSGKKAATGNLSCACRRTWPRIASATHTVGCVRESSAAGSLLFLSGMLPVVNGKLPITGRLGDDLSVTRGQEATRIASLNALAAANQHLGSLDRLKKLIKLTGTVGNDRAICRPRECRGRCVQSFSTALRPRFRPCSLGVRRAKPPSRRTCSGGHNFEIWRSPDNDDSTVSKDPAR